jgi:hypothetical protein
MNEQINYWTNYKRDDLHNIPFMIEEGYRPVFDARDIRNNRVDTFNPPHNEVGFINEKTKIRIWKTYRFGPIKNDGFRDIIITWRSAKLINNRFSEHKSHEGLIDAVNYYKTNTL